MIENFDKSDQRLSETWLDEKERAKINQMKKSDTDKYLNDIQAKFD